MALNSFDIKTIADFFLLSVSWSLILFSPIASVKLTGNGLIKLLTNISIGALVGSIIIQTTSNNFSNIDFILRIISLMAMIGITTFHKEERSKPMWILYIVNILILAYLISGLVNFILLPVLFLISSALLLGVITYSMTLGHWYLVVPKLSAAPLKIAAIITWIVLAVKIAWSAHSIYTHNDFFEEQTMLGAGYAFNWMLLTMRLSFGYLVISIMSFLNWRLLQLRSIQSSTGILYAMMFFVFVGELISTYIFFNYGLYI